MDIDKRALPDPEDTSDLAGEEKAPTSETPKNEEPISVQHPKDNSKAEPMAEPMAEPVDKIKDEIQALKQKSLELQKQKEHWREKYERDITNIQTSVVDDEEWSDEGRALKAEIDSLKGKLSSYEQKSAQDEIYAQNPELKEVKSDFEQFLTENSNLNLDQAAKLFKLEKGLAVKQPRKGLEKPTSGPKDITTEPTPEDLERARTTYSHKEYLKMYGPKSSK